MSDTFLSEPFNVCPTCGSPLAKSPEIQSIYLRRKLLVRDRLMFTSPKDFFAKAVLGEVFTYSEGFMLEDVEKLAEASGVAIFSCPPGSEEYKRLGCFTVKVVSISRELV